MRANTPVHGVLLFASFLTFFDRSLLPPLLPIVAADLDASVESIGHSVVAYVLAYAAVQLGWTSISTRIGQLRMLTVSMGVSAVGNVVSALTPDPSVFLVGRVISAVGFGATVPAVLTYFGDTLSMKRRSVATANLAAALSLGMTVGTAGASLAGEWFYWRAAFGLTAAASLVLATLLLLIAEPARLVPQPILPGLVSIARNRWALLVLGLTALEGALLVGILSYLPVSLHAAGSSILTAGLATAAFGLSVILWSQLSKLALRVVPPWALVLAGGLATVAAYVLLALTVTVVSVTTAAILLGFGWALAHTQLQTWMTDAAAGARPVGMALFAVALFGGGSLGAALGAGALATDSFPWLFAFASGLGLLFTGVASAYRARYREQDH